MSPNEEVDYIKQQAELIRQYRDKEEMFQRQQGMQNQRKPYNSRSLGGFEPNAADSVSPPLDICEYIVLGFGGSSPECVYVKDAADMQRVVERIRKEGARKEISVFKRMLRMKSTTEWETVNVDA
jgi:hypothetical protein